jgi:2,4-dienoyl-CoA reductase-like NADH-dependent reductase (Old Yellow Enzyme family)
MDAAAYRRVLEHGCDFVVVGRAAILHHDLPKLVKNDPNWKTVKTPAPPSHLRSEGISPSFVEWVFWRCLLAYCWFLWSVGEF